MAVQLKFPVTNEDIEAAVQTWLDLLAEDMYDDAYAFTLHDPYYQWTPYLLEQVINGYGLPFEEDSKLSKCKVTSWVTAEDNGSKHNKDIEWYDIPTLHPSSSHMIIGEVFYDLPIDGIWSDLTAIFQILQIDDYVTLELNDIQML
jgi:hypothetical protein